MADTTRAQTGDEITLTEWDFDLKKPLGAAITDKVRQVLEDQPPGVTITLDDSGKLVILVELPLCASEGFDGPTWYITLNTAIQEEIDVLAEEPSADNQARERQRISDIAAQLDREAANLRASIAA